MRFQTLASVPKYNAVLTKRDLDNRPDFKSVQEQLDRILNEQGLASQNIRFVTFTPEDAPAGGEPMIQPVDLPRAEVARIVKAVEAIRNSDQNHAVVKAGDGLLNVVSIPIIDQHDGHRSGTLSFGEVIDWRTAMEYSQTTRKQVALFAASNFVAATFPHTVERTRLEDIYRQLAGSTADGVPLKVNLGPDHYFCVATHFSGVMPEPGSGLLLFSSYDPSEGVRETQQLLLGAIIIAIFLGSACISFFINKATGPLRELQAAADAVGRGDFSRRVVVTSKDELGDLARAFNQMTENIELSQSKLKQTVETLKNTQAQLIQSEKLSAVGEFVAGVAHELNNPLAAVMGFSEMLKNADVGDKHKRHLELVYKSAERCQKIVQSLLSFARRSAPERKPVGVNKLIEEVLEMVAYPLRTSNVKVVTSYAAKLPVVLADGHQIQQVVLNIINNARQAIEAHSGAGCITITTQHEGSWVRVIIQDNGPGISSENLKRIFDPFFTTKGVGKGTGLGLSLCYGMIREHGGNI
ncbi:MAG TPA: HAMP domain-containing sensor histidine kinase, partial [Verrucomicrobiae bacterium]